MVGRPSFPRNIDKVLSSKEAIGPPGEWKRKSDEEIQEEKKKLRKSSYDLTMPTLLPFFILSPLLINIFIDLSDPTIIKTYFIIYIPSLILILLGQIIKGRSFVKSPKIKICRKCLREDHLNLKRCYCGGLYEPPEFYKFIVDKSIQKSGK